VLIEQDVDISSGMGKCIGGEAEGKRVGLPDALIERVDGVDDRHWPKGLLAHDARGLRHFNKNRHRIEVSTARDALSASCHTGALRLEAGLHEGRPHTSLGI
jgi:hypothetical protein